MHNLQKILIHSLQFTPITISSYAIKFKAEKEAASSIPPLRDLSEASTVENDTAVDSTSAEQNADAPIRIFKWDKDTLQLCQQCKLVSTIVLI